MVYLTICLPTRNRQAYCIQTIEAIAEATGDDFEVIVSDNSDDPAPLADYFANTLKDPRFRLIAPGPAVLSMVDNWERVLSEAQGRWISVIGDDDYIDPRVTGLLRRCEVLYRDVEAVNWDCMTFQWPDNRPAPTLATIPLASSFQRQDLEATGERLFAWSERKRRPSAGVGIYHGAVRKTLMERIKARFGGRYFEHPIVDWDNTCKVVAEAKTAVHCERPFSVLGASLASNSASIQSRKVMEQRLDAFKRESESSISLDQPFFPFAMVDAGSSLCLSIATLTAWFCENYNVPAPGFGENFAAAAMDECKHSFSQAEYDAKVSCFARGFKEWQGGKWAHLFKPAPFKAPRTVNELSGVSDETLHIRESAITPETPAEFYRFGENAIVGVEPLLAGTKVFAL